MADVTPGSPPGFELGAGFARAEISGMLGLGRLELEYQELFADVLEDGVITADERGQLERAADNLGLERGRLQQLEEAMIAAYEAHHRVRIVEQYQRPAASLVLPLGAGLAADREILVARIAELEVRVRQLEEELRRAQASMHVVVDLSELEPRVAAQCDDPAECWRRVRRDPTSEAGYQDLYRIYAAQNDLDRQWCVASALAALRAASSEQRELFERHRSDVLIAPRCGVSASAWYDELLHPEQEVLTGNIFGVIAPAVLIGRVATLRRDKTLQQLDASTRQDPTRTTVTAARALAWAASILGLAPPNVHVDPERDVGYAYVPGVPPLSLVGNRVLTGKSQLEHAFLAARHLSYYRQEHYVKILFGAVPDLEDLFLSALTIANPKLPLAADVKRRVEPIARAIEPLLEARQLDALRGHLLRFVEEGGRTNLMRWSAAVDKTACRAGLLLSNDLATVLDILEQEEGRLGELGKDLLAFAVSERYFALRRRLGISIGSA